MRLMPLSLIVSMAAAGVHGLAQTPASAPATPVFDVVSIKPHTGDTFSSSMRQRPDGGFAVINLTLPILLAQAYPVRNTDIIGLPGWASSDRYDITATATLGRNATADERRQMLQAMADRFKLAAHLETRDQPAFALVLARSDGRLGPQLKRSEIDYAARAAAQRAAAEAARAAGAAPSAPQIPPVPPAPGSPVPRCSVRMTGDRMEGDMTMASLAGFLRPAAGRLIVD